MRTSQGTLIAFCYSRLAAGHRARRTEHRANRQTKQTGHTARTGQGLHGTKQEGQGTEARATTSERIRVRDCASPNAIRTGICDILLSHQTLNPKPSRKK